MEKADRCDVKKRLRDPEIVGMLWVKFVEYKIDSKAGTDEENGISPMGVGGFSQQVFHHFWRQGKTCCGCAHSMFIQSIRVKFTVLHLAISKLLQRLFYDICCVCNFVEGKGWEFNMS